MKIWYCKNIKFYFILLLTFFASLSYQTLLKNVGKSGSEEKMDDITSDIESDEKVQHVNTTVQNNLINLTSKYYITSALSYMSSFNFLKCRHAFCKKIPGSNFMIEEIPESAGQLIIGPQNKMYLVTKEQVRFADAWTECCKWNMIPASVESRETLYLLLLRYDKNVINGSTILLTTQMDSTLDRRFISCSSGNLVPREVFLPGEPDNKDKREACLAIKLEKWDAGLVDIHCGDTANVLCEMTENLQKFTSSRNLTTPNLKNKNNFTETMSSETKATPFSMSRSPVKMISTTVKPRNIMTTTPWSKIPQMPTATTRFTMPPILATTRITVFTNKNVFHTKQIRN